MAHATMNKTMPSPADSDRGGGGGGFRQRLYRLRRDKGWTQSELARRIWGETEDARGYKVARNRDRISAYEAGRATPERANLDALAEALGVTVEELAPDLVPANPNIRSDAGGASMSLKVVPGTTTAHLTVDAIVPMTLALKVLDLLAPKNEDAAG